MDTQEMRVINRLVDEMMGIRVKLGEMASELLNFERKAEETESVETEDPPAT